MAKTTYADVQQHFVRSLSTFYDESEVKQMFIIALGEVNGMRLSDYLLRREAPAPPADAARLELIMQRLAQGEPLQHILGVADFYGMRLRVTPDTLIPRPETEELVDHIIQDYHSQPGIRLIDIGTGSGCIAVALAKNLKQAEVWAMDISSEAIAVARHNAEQQGQDIEFICADILEWEVAFDPEVKFDVIVSNPPYVTPGEKDVMHINVLQYEPQQALFVEAEAPLLYYDHIADFARIHLSQGGALYFEINQYLGQETADLIRKKGFLDVRVLKDINGSDRMIVAKKG